MSIWIPRHLRFLQAWKPTILVWYSDQFSLLFLSHSLSCFFLSCSSFFLTLFLVFLSWFFPSQVVVDPVQFQTWYSYEWMSGETCLTDFLFDLIAFSFTFFCFLVLNHWIRFSSFLIDFYSLMIWVNNPQVSDLFLPILHFSFASSRSLLFSFDRMTTRGGKDADSAILILILGFKQELDWRKNKREREEREKEREREREEREKGLKMDGIQGRDFLFIYPWNQMSLPCVGFPSLHSFYWEDSLQTSLLLAPTFGLPWLFFTLTKFPVNSLENK